MEAQIIGLSETKLSKRLIRNGWVSMQTRNARYGGCWTASKLTQVKPIKALSTNITWLSVALQAVPIHVITCYFQPMQQWHTKESLQRLVAIVDDIKAKSRKSRIVILGDFNELRLETERALAEKGLLPLVEQPLTGLAVTWIRYSPTLEVE
jgi:hypothetical protein